MNNAMREPVAYLLPDGNGLELSCNRPRQQWTDELDLVGPYGGAVVRRHGQVMPFNAHFMAPMLEQAAGGALIDASGWRAAALAAVLSAFAGALVATSRRSSPCRSATSSRVFSSSDG